MSEIKRILLTGAAGYIGSAIARDLEAAGFLVVAVSRRAVSVDAGDSGAVQSEGSGAAPESPGNRSESPEKLRSEYQTGERVVCDLTDAEATARALAHIKPCDGIVHAAARIDSGKSAVEGSLSMLRNLFDATSAWNARWIYLSSVSIYGDADRTAPVAAATAELRPATNYGRSKLACEEFLQQQNAPDCRILRVTPVYSPGARRNVAVRVYLPGTPIRMRIRPEPRHSLCALAGLAAQVRRHLLEAAPRRIVEHAADAEVYGQHELAAQFERGPLLPISEIIFRPMYRILCWIPGGLAYRLRCVYWKLFRSNVYEPPAAIPPGGARPR
ncbi:MAG: NAD(P)-dependent oxidoreductase [bacterium]|nr:NAD(P)-dependent oxidoreductase [bacterium]